MTLSILYQDDSMVAISKPSGMLVHRGAARDGEIAMLLLRDQIGAWVYPVHRLDRATSGVLLFGLTKTATAALQASLTAGQKEYYALVRGTPPESAHIDHPVPNEEGGVKVEARTDMTRFAFFNPEGAPFPNYYSWVSARPSTGRRHQIRRHLRHLGHPLIGDTTYGRADHNHYFRDAFGLKRLALHASSIVLDHPLSGESMRLFAPLPDDLREPLICAGLVHATVSENRTAVNADR